MDMRALDEKGLAAIRGTQVAYVAQSAAAAFNPAHTIMDQVVESALIHGSSSRAEAEAKAVELFRRSPCRIRRRSAAATRTRFPAGSCSVSWRPWR